MMMTEDTKLLMHVAFTLVTSVVAGFRAAGSCLPEGPPPEQLAYCTPEEPFAKVNLPSGDFYRIEKAAAATDFWTQLLCVAADRNPSLGMHYPDPPAGDVGTNAQHAACPAKELPAASASSSSYSYGHMLTVSAPAATGRVKGPFSLPAGVLSSECLDVAQVGFMARMPPSLKVVLAAHFVFAYAAGSSNGEGGQLSSVGVALVLGNASMPAGGAPLVLHTQFSVSWVNSSAPVGALQSFSGAPGYLPGFPVLAGVLAAAPAASSSSTAAATKVFRAGPAGCSCQLRTFCKANEPAANLTELLGGGWMNSQPNR
ncbi:hypothetical protein COO60DRAFT_1643641 [Scenedesmus sp. NREL 46B-D3]|nr:hypothetical protein COO60DRAFT_1643641 [Scenedesmus sp. NREL 46B-D3]